MYRALDMGVSVEAFWEMSPRAIWVLQQELIRSMQRHAEAKAERDAPKRLNYIPR